MAEKRKLQAEIDRVLKKVSEGIEEFDLIHEKFRDASQPNLKEKYEGELKKEIKKLQRLRDQIKTWAADKDIKNKDTLLENRRRIETCMETFKVVEKETKTKAYSKEGLGLAAKKDPKEQQKDGVRNWVAEVLDQLTVQIDVAEVELDGLASSGKKKKRGDDSERKEVLDQLIETNKMHMSSLETLLRMLDNDTVTCEEIENIKEDIMYYVENNQEPDFEFEAYGEDLYEDFDFDRLPDEWHVAATSDIPENEPVKEEPERHEKKRGSKRDDDDHGSIHTKADDTSTTTAATTTKSATKTVSAPVPEKRQMPKTPVVTIPAAMPPKPAVAYAGVTAGKASTAQTHKEESTAISSSGATKTTSAAGATSPKDTTGSAAVRNGPDAMDVSQAPPGLEQVVPDKISSIPPDQDSSGTAPDAVKAADGGVAVPDVSNQPATAQSAGEAGSAIDGGALERKHILAMLDASYQNCPQAADSERSPIYLPSQPAPTPPYYPQIPLQLFHHGEAYEKLPLDTLFFIFYYQQNSFQQYFAACELKNKSWRFHKKYKTWFQRYEEPKMITDEYEQGTYLFFDFETDWVQRRKSDFAFEYHYLEDQEML
eukprot:Clim_evm20s39 gene=Clim_evmTU20s39